VAREEEVSLPPVAKFPQPNQSNRREGSNIGSPPICSPRHGHLRTKRKTRTSTLHAPKSLVPHLRQTHQNQSHPFRTVTKKNK